MKRILLKFFWVLFVVSSIQAYAQNQSISGKVTGNDDGLPLAGVSVTIKGSKFGTQTGADGRFTLQVPQNGTLVFSFLGFATKEVAASSGMNVTLSAVPNQLSEVVVLPFSTAKKDTYTGSAAAIGAKDIGNRPVSNALNAIAGITPGVQVLPSSGVPGSTPTIRIRGVGSFNSGNGPMYVVDGVQYEGAISNINPEDIENMTVLKDASATALYGARAANGVIMITTKRGKKGTSQLSVKATQAIISRAIPEYDRLDAYQYYPVAWETYRNSLVYAASNPLTRDQANTIASGLGTRNANNLQTLNGRTYQDISQVLGSLVLSGRYAASNNPFNVPSTQLVDVNGVLNPAAQLRYDDLDWLKATQRTSDRKDYSVNYGSGTDKGDFFSSLGYTQENGFARKSDFRRITGRINANIQPVKWLKTGANLSGNFTEQNLVGSGSTSYVNPFYFSRNIAPIYNVYAHNPTTGEYLLDGTGKRIYDLGGLTALGVPGRASGASPGRHIVQETELNQANLRRNVLTARAYAEITFLKDFKFTQNIAADYSNLYDDSYDNEVVGDGAPAGRAFRTRTLNTTYNLFQTLTYTKNINKHGITALIGHENYSTFEDQLTAGRTNVVLPGNSELNNFTTTGNVSSYKDRFRIEGYFSRFNYNYDDKYLLEASVRRDGLSKLSSENRWGTFASFGAGWRIDREDFMRAVSWVDLLKLRGSWGTVGNKDIPGLYSYQTFYNPANNALEPGFIAATTLGNVNIKWETQRMTDIGLEFGLFKNRLQGTFEYFDRGTNNLVFLVPLPRSSGYLNQYDNIGRFSNRGFELSLSGDVVRSKNFNWNLNTNFTRLKNKVLELPNAAPIVDGIVRLEEGRSRYDFYTRIYKGVDPADGAALYVPKPGTAAANLRTVNGESVTTSQSDALLDYTGDSALPDLSGAVTNTFTYKDFTFSFLVNYQLGGKIYDTNYASLMSVGSYGGGIHKDALNSWHNPGDITSIPRLDQANAANLYAGSSRWLTSASYLWFRNATITYNLPKSLISKVEVKNARIFFSGENLYMIGSRKGMDASQTVGGTVTNAYVPQRILSLGLNVSL
ncbi:SusC/RagA family TonB-linked outer membrane protein [Mucilaginibacter aquatilis]|uniref:SusC/RagA family TonB-linked outer membrane protein n=1 Tax=Mucilaginibacter aquatilis TaxID=1517760 RepID=A0A6I4IRL7_9SPHI|nr:TonB-dependent receptor [Mucilaginibacter aquatilis]MVN93084.1 SusC/RagA family TonB-linked outer membrane protein [Mucilaginibacter aquatilis]